MLSGSEQSVLVELDEKERQTIWKKLEKDAKLKLRANTKTSGSGGGGFGGGGFGGGGSSRKTKKKKTGANAKKEQTQPSTKTIPKIEAKEQATEHTEFDLNRDKEYKFGSLIVDRGVARIDGRLSPQTALELLDFINDYLNEALTTDAQRDLTLEEIYKQQPYFADVREKHNRWDVLLPFFIDNENDNDETVSKRNNGNGAVVQKALWELLVKDTVLSDSIASILGSDTATLYELGSLISDPGSERQLLHADYNYQPDFQPTIPPALTCFVALQDIDATMGPTTFLPSSATEEHHEEIAIGQHDGYGTENGSSSNLSELLSKSGNNLSLLRTGDCALYNPMTLHCGNANKSNKRRVIFYFSFKNKKYNEKDWPLAYASLRPDLRSQSLSLEDIQQIVSTTHSSSSSSSSSDGEL